MNRCQNYSHDADRQHIRRLIPALQDQRYIRIDGKSLFLVFRTELLPNPPRTAESLREDCRNADVEEIYVARVENFVRGIAPAMIGFDAAIKFASDSTSGSARHFRPWFERAFANVGLLPRIFHHEWVVSYTSIARAMVGRPAAAFTRFRSVTLMWGNTARRGKSASVYFGSTPEIYEDWFRRVINLTRAERVGKERFVLIDAWNEWAEGCHLAPDQKWGRRCLEATLNGISISPDSVPKSVTTSALKPTLVPGSLRRTYSRLQAVARIAAPFVRQRPRLSTAVTAHSHRP